MFLNCVALMLNASFSYICIERPEGSVENTAFAVVRDAHKSGSMYSWKDEPTDA